MKNLYAFILALVICPACTPTTKTAEGCLYSREEIKAAFGSEVTKFYGTKTHPKRGEGHISFCHYVVGSPSVSSLTVVLASSGRNTELPKSLPDPWMKGTESIPGDADGALWRIAGPSSLQLIYFRGNTQTKIVIYHDPSQLDNVKRRALELRRIP